MNNKDLSWEEQKMRAQELAARKRSRDKDGVEQESQEEGPPRKKARILQYELMDEDWAELQKDYFRPVS